MIDTILRVDDDPSTMEVLGNMREDKDYLQFPPGGSDALRPFQEAVPDLVLLDAEMPGINGSEVFRAFKTIPALSEVPVMFLSPVARKRILKWRVWEAVLQISFSNQWRPLGASACENPVAQKTYG